VKVFFPCVLCIPWLESYNSSNSHNSLTNNLMSIIKVENLSKRYIIGHDRRSQGAFRYKSLRDSLTHFGRSAYQRVLHPLSPNRENTEMEVLKF